MTMIVALHLNAYVLIAADKRETFQVNGEVVSIVRDDVQKLVEWPGGVATGSGYVPLLDDFKVKLDQSIITTNIDIIEIAKECSNNLPSNQSEWKKSTNWLFTYPAVDQNSSIIRVAFIESQSPDEIRALEIGKAIIWTKVVDPEYEISKLNELIKPIKNLSSFEDSLVYHITILKALYSYVASVNISVSESFDVFFQTSTAKRIIPNIQ